MQDDTKIKEKQYKRALFIHRRDLRVQDNTALNEAVSHADEVLSSFIFDPVQVGKENEYRSEKQLGFMIQSLEDLQKQYEKVDGRLHLFSGKPAKVVEKLIAPEKIDAVFCNADYTPYSNKRDSEIKAMCEKAGILFITFHDLLLSGDPEQIKNGSDKPFVVFTPYWKKAAAMQVAKPRALKNAHFVRDLTKNVNAKDSANNLLQVSLEDFRPTISNENTAEQGGRVEARKILANASDQARYASLHNIPSLQTSRLSAHNKFGTVSIREVYYAFGNALGFGHPLLRQLYWRDFYTSIVYFFPHVIGSSFDPKHEILFKGFDSTSKSSGKSPDNSYEKKLEKWQQGMTGIPIVDAGMRELLATGYMHNRVRLITGSFLTKDLHLPWWLGEKHFAQQLVDYDISLNNGNWQWVGGTGVDPVPYFRIFNPWLQGKKFDPQAVYIKQWVPELRELTPAQIHSIPTKPLPDSIEYPKPMVDHTEEMRKVKDLYKK